MRASTTGGRGPGPGPSARDGVETHGKGAGFWLVQVRTDCLPLRFCHVLFRLVLCEFALPPLSALLPDIGLLPPAVEAHIYVADHPVARLAVGGRSATEAARAPVRCSA